MEDWNDAREDLRLTASQFRVLADLMLSTTDLQDVDPAALAHVLQDLTSRLERGLDRLDVRAAHLSALPDHREERP